MRTAPRGLRLYIGLFGRRNVGKSSLTNALVGEQVSVVSEVPGTTTDPVEKPLEMDGLGPVVILDTAGLDDEGSPLGGLRVDRARKALERVDTAVVVARADTFGAFEEALLTELARRAVPTVVALNMADVAEPAPALRERLAERALAVVRTVAPRGEGVRELAAAIAAAAPRPALEELTLVGDLVPPGGGAYSSCPSIPALPAAGSFCRRCKPSATRSITTPWPSSSESKGCGRRSLDCASRRRSW